MPRVELSNGAYAILRGPETVRNRERRNAARATDKVDGLASKDLAYVDSLIGQLLESWSLELPMPTDAPDVFDDLKPDDYDALRDAALGVYAEARGLNVEPDPDPGSPTTPSSD